MSYQMKDDFAVGMGFEGDIPFDLLAQDPVVIDLAIDCQKDCPLVIHKGLGTTVYVLSARQIAGWLHGRQTDANDTQSLMGKDCNFAI